MSTRDLLYWLKRVAEACELLTKALQSIGEDKLEIDRVDFIGEIIGRVKVDIEAQTVGNIAVDIAAQSVGDIGISINAVAAGLNLPVDIVAQSVGNIKVDLASQSVGNVAVDIAAQSVGDIGISINAIATGVVFDVNITGAVTLDVNIAGVATDVTFDVNIAASAVTLDVNLASSSITLDVNIKSQTATIDVNIAASDITLNVNVQGTASVSIDNASVYLNVQHEDTWGKCAWIVDTLNEYDTLLTSYTGYGIALVPGRGFIGAIRLRVKEISGSDQTLTICFSIAPGMPPVYKLNVTIPANYDGIKSVWNVNHMWNYETMFVYIESTNSNVQVYAKKKFGGCYWLKQIDTVTYDLAYQICIGIMYRALRRNSIPIEGTVNTIQIPNRTAPREIAADIAVEPMTEVTIFSIKGTGRHINSRFLLDEETFLAIRVYIDGHLIDACHPEELYNYNINRDNGMWRLLRYDTSVNRFEFALIGNLPFKETLEIRAYNMSSTTTYNVVMAITICEKVDLSIKEINKIAVYTVTIADLGVFTGLLTILATSDGVVILSCLKPVILLHIMLNIYTIIYLLKEGDI